MPAKWRNPEPVPRIAVRAGNATYLVGVIENRRVACPHCGHKMPIRKQGFRTCYHCTFYFYASQNPALVSIEEASPAASTVQL